MHSKLRIYKRKKKNYRWKEERRKNRWTKKRNQQFRIKNGGWEQKTPIKQKLKTKQQKAKQQQWFQK